MYGVPPSDGTYGFDVGRGVGGVGAGLGPVGVYADVGRGVGRGVGSEIGWIILVSSSSNLKSASAMQASAYAL